MTFNRAAKTAPAGGLLREDRFAKEDRHTAPVSVQSLLWQSQSQGEKRPQRASSATAHREQAFGQHREYRTQAPNANPAIQDEWDKCLGTMRALLSRMDTENRSARQSTLPRGVDMDVFSGGPRKPVRASHTVCPQGGRVRSASSDCRQEATRTSSRCCNSAGGAPLQRRRPAPMS